MKKIDRVLQRYRYSVVEPFVPDKSDVLDIGGFDGSFLLRLRDRINRGVCIDPYIEEKKDGKIEFIRAMVVDRLPFPNESFDIITMLAVYEHFQTSRELITSEIFRILKDHGLVLLTVPSSAVDHILKILIKMRLIDGMSIEEHSNFNAADTVEIFTQCGFRLRRWSKFQFGLNNLFVFEKINPAEQPSDGHE